MSIPPSNGSRSIQVGTVTLPDGVVNSTDITIAVWVYWDGGNAWQRVFDFGNDTTSYMFLTPLSADNTMRFAITTDSNDGEQILNTDPLPAGAWVHLAVTLGGNTGIVYINGAPRVAGRILLDPSDINPVHNHVGKSQWPDPPFDGMVDDLRIYHYALDQTQIAELFHNPDFNNNGTVDAADYVEWRMRQGTMYDLADYNTWRSHFGAHSGSAASSRVGPGASRLDARADYDSEPICDVSIASRTAYTQ